MYRSCYIFWAIFVWFSITGGESKRQIVYNTIECSIKGKVFSKVDCQLYSRLAMNLAVTIGEQKADKMVVVCDVKFTYKDRQKITRIRNLNLEVCQMRKVTERRSVLGMYYNALRRSAVNFPKKCPFEKNTTLIVNRLHFGWQEIPQYLPDSNYSFVGKIYANKELGMELKLTGGYYDISNYSIYTKPLI